MQKSTTMGTMLPERGAKGIGPLPPPNRGQLPGDLFHLLQDLRAPASAAALPVPFHLDTFDPWISKLVGPILAIQGSSERYLLGLCIHGSFETNQNSGAEGGGG